MLGTTTLESRYDDLECYVEMGGEVIQRGSEAGGRLNCSDATVIVVRVRGPAERELTLVAVCAAARAAAPKGQHFT